MKIFKRFIAASALAVIVATPLLVATPVNAAVIVSDVVVDVDGVKIVVGTGVYGEISLGLGDVQLENYLKNGNSAPKISALKIGDKYLDIAEYGQNLLFTSSVEEAVEQTTGITPNGFKKVSKFDGTGKPILEDIAPAVSEFKVTDIW